MPWVYTAPQSGILYGLKIEGLQRAWEMSFFSEINQSFKEFAANFRDAGKERLRNPLLRSYVAFWFLMNWRILAILLLGDASIESRLELIDLYRYPPYSAFLSPLALAALYVFLMPRLSLFVFQKTTRFIQEQKLARMDLELALAAKRLEIARSDVRKAQVREEEAVNLNQRKLNYEIQKLDNINRHEIEKLRIEGDNRVNQLVFELQQKDNQIMNLKGDIQNRETEIQRIKLEKENLADKVKQQDKDNLHWQSENRKLENTLKRQEKENDRLRDLILSNGIRVK